MVSVNNIGIWTNLGTVTPNLSEFVPFGQTDNLSSLFRVYTSGEIGNVRTWFRQKFDGFIDNRWVRFYPENGTNKLLNLPVSTEIKENKIIKIIEVKNTPLYRKYGNDADPIFHLTLYQFVPFQISSPLLNEGNTPTSSEETDPIKWII
jgi:hypothetical protein